MDVWKGRKESELKRRMKRKHLSHLLPLLHLFSLLQLLFRDENDSYRESTFVDIDKVAPTNNISWTKHSLFIMEREGHDFTTKWGERGRWAKWNENWRWIANKNMKREEEHEMEGGINFREGERRRSLSNKWSRIRLKVMQPGFGILCLLSVDE